MRIGVLRGRNADLVFCLQKGESLPEVCLSHAWGGPCHLGDLVHLGSTGRNANAKTHGPLMRASAFIAVSQRPDTISRPP